MPNSVLRLNKLNRSYETDRLVTEAIGATAESFGDWYFETEQLEDLCLKGGWLREFQPSVDLNAALWAAEQVAKYGFALHTPSLQEQSDDEKWQCILGITEIGDGRQMTIKSWAKTPAMAICKAILKLKAEE